MKRGSFTIIPRKGGGYEILVDDGREIVSRPVDRELGEAVLTAVQVAALPCAGPRDTEAKRVTDFSRAQLDDARRLILARYDEMVQAARQSFYASMADAIRAAARELVAERWLTSELAEAAVTEAIALAARGGRSGQEAAGRQMHAVAPLHVRADA